MRTTLSPSVSFVCICNKKYRRRYNFRLDLPTQFQCLVDQLLRLYGECICRSGRPQPCYAKLSSKGVLKSFARFKKKQLWRSLVFSKFVGCRPSTSLKKEPCHRCCPVSFAKFSTYFVNHLQTTGSLYYQTNID